MSLYPKAARLRSHCCVVAGWRTWKRTPPIRVDRVRGADSGAASYGDCLADREAAPNTSTMPGR